MGPGHLGVNSTPICVETLRPMCLVDKPRRAKADSPAQRAACRYIREAPFTRAALATLPLLA